MWLKRSNSDFFPAKAQMQAPVKMTTKSSRATILVVATNESKSMAYSFTAVPSPCR
ncbi:hypothetical protein D3C86_653920 [compost metagenome]